MERPPAELILRGGKVVTVDTGFRIHQAIGIAGEKIVSVGTDGEVETSAGHCTRRINLAGHTVIPGLIDGHAHMDNEGLSLDSVSTSSDVLFYDQLLLHLRGNADSLQPGRAFRLVDSMVSNNPAYRERAASITSIEHFPGDGITTPLIIITVRVGNDTETFHLADDPLRHLVRWENDRGEHLSLRKRLFLDYWNRSRPGDEQWLE